LLPLFESYFLSDSFLSLSFLNLSFLSLSFLSLSFLSDSFMGDPTPSTLPLVTSFFLLPTTAPFQITSLVSS
jgi:hypothetical protein